MSHVLEYERPLHVERRSLPLKATRLMVVAAVAVALSALIAQIFLRHAIRQVVVIGPVVAAGVLSALAYSSAVTSVFADRLQLSLSIATLPIWSKRLPLITLTEATPVQNAYPSGKREFSVLRRSPGLTVIMFGGRGLKLVTADKSECWLGSTDPKRLLAAIETAKQSGGANASQAKIER